MTERKLYATGSAGRAETVSTQSLFLNKNQETGISWLALGLFLLIMVTGVGLAYVSVHLSFNLAILGILAVIGGTLIIRNPEFGLLVLVFAIPFEDFNQIGQLGSLSLIKLLGIAMLGAYLIHYLVFGRDEPLIMVKENAFIALLLLAVLVSDIIAANQEYAIDKTLKLLRVVAFYFLVINIVRSKRTLNRVLWVMIFSGVTTALYGMYEYYFRPELLQDARVTGTMDDPMAFSYLMLILVPIVWHMLSQHKRLLFRLFLLGSGGLFLYSILLSGTRSAMLAIAGVLVFIAIREKHPVLNLLIAGMIVLSAFIFLPEQVQNRLGLTENTDKAAQASTERRLTYLDFGWQLFLEKPLLGSGLGGFAEGYSQSEYQFLRSSDDARRIAHNMYLEILTGTGLVGLIPFLLLMFTPLLTLQRTIRASRWHTLSSEAKMIQVSLAAFLFIGFFSSSQYDKPLWLLVGLAAVIPVLAKQQEKEFEQAERIA